MMQPSVLMNRFIINLKSLSPAGLSHGSSVQCWSRFTVPNIYIQDSFLGNIGEDLQHGHKPVCDDYDGNKESDTTGLNIQSFYEVELEESSITHGSSGTYLMDTQVCVHIHSGLKPRERACST